MLDRKTELINYFINKLNTNIDLTSIENSDGSQKYSTEPFKAIIFRETDSGSITQKPIPGIIQNMDPEYKYIPVDFSNADLGQENIFKVNITPLELWLGIVTLQFLISITDITEYAYIYLQLQDFHDAYIKNETDTLTIFGANRSIETTSKKLRDVNGTLSKLNKTRYKVASMEVTTTITNPGIARGSRYRVLIDDEDTYTLATTFDYIKETPDNTISGNDFATFIPDIAVRQVQISVVYDEGRTYINKIFDELDGTTDIATEYAIKITYTTPVGNSKNISMNMMIDNIKALPDPDGYIIWQITFKEVS